MTTPSKVVRNNAEHDPNPNSTPKYQPRRSPHLKVLFNGDAADWSLELAQYT